MKLEMNSSMEKRLRILGDDEIEAIYDRPRFTAEERLQYFALLQPEEDLIPEFRSVHSQLYFILQLGYFKAKQLFFTFDLAEVEEDVQFILARYFPQAQIEEVSIVNKRTNLRQRHLILELCHYRLCGAQERQQLDAKAGRRPGSPANRSMSSENSCSTWLSNTSLRLGTVSCRTPSARR